MVEYLLGLLQRGDTFTVDVYTLDGEHYRRCGLVAVDAVGLVVDNEGYMALPWGQIRLCTTEHV